MYDITALGELLIDFTPYGLSENKQKLFEQNPGGAPVNVLATASNFNLKTAFIGKVGNDMHGLFLKKILDNKKIETKGLMIDDSCFTTLAFVSLNDDGERDFSFARKPGADTMLSKEEVNTTLIANSKVFHIGSLSLTTEPCRSATLFALNTAKASNCIISYDPNYRAPLWKDIETAKEMMQSIIPYTDIIKISDEELSLLTPYNNPEDATQYLMDQGVSIAAVTLGKDGSYVRTKDGGRYVKGFSVKVIDTTGAGDSFWGSFIYGLLNCGKSLEDISLNEISEFALFANATSSICIEGRGAIPSLPNLKMVRQRLDEKQE